MRMEMGAAPLIYFNPKRDSSGSVLIVTNDSVFKMYADYCRQQIGSHV